MPVIYDGLEFERLGHASVRIETDDRTVVYVDPWGEILEGDPADGDVVFVTYDDMDHYDAAAIEAVAGTDVTVAAYEAIDTDDLEADGIRVELF
ncbi:hypothetical protein NJ7G_3466 [Natrinema sp. J7-2]|nr:hypothetical protein NJ7G_3466 [Natrinema sp. J7-2]